MIPLRPDYPARGLEVVTVHLFQIAMQIDNFSKINPL
jgi:hypothetical protein